VCPESPYFVQGEGPVTSLSSRVIKRLIDLVGACLLGLLAIPILFIAICAILIVDPGPIFFRQRRTGQHGRTFVIMKLRSMRVDADRWLVSFLTENPDAPDPRIERSAHDPRIIPYIGRFIRRYSIDELPQLINVLIGDMSFVGPRPLPDYHLMMLSDEIQSVRSRVRPGITGLWQIRNRLSKEVKDIESCDQEYLNSLSLKTDLRILYQTVFCVFRGSGV
jgi:lipopolysaccharide/colanic/teichoic acid biosynthesis glycosyltransferase